MWQSYSCTAPLYSSNYLTIWMSNDVIYTKSVCISFQKTWAVQFDVTEPGDTVISTQDTILYLKNLLMLSSIVFLEWLDKKNMKKNFKQRTPFPLATNSNGTRKPKSYTRNSFRVEHRAGLHFEHRNHETEHTLCFARRSASVRLYLSFHPCSQLCLFISPHHSPINSGPFICQHLRH